MRRGLPIGLAAVIVASSAAPPASAESSVQAQIDRLQRQIHQLQAQLSEVEATKAAKKKRKKAKPGPAGPAGPQGTTGPAGAQGPQGPAGSAPACQGNGAGDTMVSAGSVCIDRYEVSVWSSPTGGTQYGVGTDDYPCDDDGQDCTGANAIYARSVPGVGPSAHITWFQAQQALANVGKRLPSNAEWQQAAAGTPDSTACNVDTGVMANTGASPGCVSRFGANDMVGNAGEWVGDWVAASTACPGWGAFSDDFMCLSGASTTATNPAALHRGGGFNSLGLAGPFAVLAQSPAAAANSVGFRGAR